MKKDEVGHNFLARLGKTRLRPGGRKATEWLIASGDFNKDTAIGLAQKFDCKIEGVDLDEAALEKARANIAMHGLQDKIHVQRANAMVLPFEDESFDIVINEAMLTMLPVQAKMKAVAEYFRVLKPGGFLLTHDVMLTTEDSEAVLQQLREAINITVTPLTKQGWKNVFLDSGFRNVETYNGDMTLLSPSGMLYDEGVLGTLKIIKNALKAENRSTFKKMFNVFNDPQKKLNFIAVCSQK